MPTQAEMGRLRAELERLRDELLAGTLNESQTWVVLEKTSAMLDQARGGQFEKHLQAIYSLLSAVWDNLRLQRQHRIALADEYDPRDVN